MAVCRKRSTNMAPDFLSTSYLTGAPPCGISMMTLTSCGGFSPTLMLERSMGPLSLRYGVLSLSHRCRAREGRRKWEWRTELGLGTRSRPGRCALRNEDNNQKTGEAMREHRNVIT